MASEGRREDRREFQSGSFGRRSFSSFAFAGRDSQLRAVSLTLSNYFPSGSDVFGSMFRSDNNVYNQQIVRSSLFHQPFDRLT